MIPVAFCACREPQLGFCFTASFRVLFCFMQTIPIVLITATLLPLSALANTSENVPQTLSAVQKSLSGTTTLYAEFEQIRQLKLLQKPLISRGTLQYRKTSGICWQLIEPVPATVYLSRHNVLMRDGVSSQTIANSNPTLQLFSDLLFSVFEGDFAALEHRFDLAWQSDTNGWTLILQPRDSLMMDLVSSIAVTGLDHIRQVSLVHKGGDSTVLNFNQVAVTPNSGTTTSGCEDAPS